VTKVKCEGGLCFGLYLKRTLSCRGTGKNKNKKKKKKKKNQKKRKKKEKIGCNLLLLNLEVPRSRKVYYWESKSERAG